MLRALDGVRGMFTSEGIFNRPDVRAAEMGAANGVTNARSLAKLYAATVGPVDGVGPLLTPQQVEAATTVQVSGNDKVLMFEMTFGLGYLRSSPTSLYGGTASFGHSGAGGSVGFADPVNQLGVGYVMNRMKQSLTGDLRSAGLVRASYEAIGVEPTYV
jgi:CubicO group peptidase (beta-lactamase class C family)